MRLISAFLLLAVFTSVHHSCNAQEDGKLRIICFGAHPDDAEYKSGGTAALWASKGHKVKLVSVTNGDIGHWSMAGGPLAKRRTAESAKVAERLGVTSEVLDIHDGRVGRETPRTRDLLMALNAAMPVHCLALHR